MLTDWAIKLIAKWSYDYIKMSCEEGKCYGVLAVRLSSLERGSRQLMLAWTGTPNLLCVGTVSHYPRTTAHRRQGHSSQASCHSERVRPPPRLFRLELTTLVTAGGAPRSPSGSSSS